MQDRARRIAEQSELRWQHARGTLESSVRDRLKAASDGLQRNALGLIEGIRKQQELLHERHRHRVQAVQRVVAVRSGDLATATVKLRERLRSRQAGFEQRLQFRAGRLNRDSVLRRVDASLAALDEKTNAGMHSTRSGCWTVGTV